MVKNLSFTYPGSPQETVKDISFSIDKGEIFGFLGPSGAGKSTTQKILIKLLQPFRGEVEILDKPLQEWTASFYNHIGVGFELPNHYRKLSAIENLRFFGSFYQREVRDPHELLEMVGLLEHADKRVEEYSKGMKMRLNFLRAIMHDPDMIFLDEPTAGLDPVNARLLKDIILDLRKAGKTIFITTHNMQDAEELCDRIAFIVDGELALINSPKALMLQFGERNVRVEYGEQPLKSSEFPLDDLGKNQDFLRLLQNEPIHTIHTREATLEDIFIKVTGIHLNQPV